MSTHATRLALVAIVAAAIGAYFAFDLGQYLSLAELKRQRDALAALADAKPLLILVHKFRPHLIWIICFGKFFAVDDIEQEINNFDTMSKKIITFRHKNHRFMISHRMPCS